MKFRSALLVALLLAPSPADAMFLQVVEDQVTMSGEVQFGDVERLQQVLAAGPITTVILSNSPGGVSIVGQRLMNMIRERGLNTAVSGYCFSACANMFLAGVKRQFADTEPFTRTYLGFHGTYEGTGTGGTGQLALSEIYTRKQQYIAYLGAGADEALIDKWLRLPTASGVMLMFNGAKVSLQPVGGQSILVCPDLKTPATDCEKILGKDAFTAAIATTRDMLAVKKPK